MVYFFVLSLSQLVHESKLSEYNNCLLKRIRSKNIHCDKQLKLSEVGNVPIKKLNQTDFDKANLKLIINTVSPFSLIEHPAFIYCKLTSNKTPASRRNLMRDVENLFNKMTKEMVEEFENIKHVCLTVDCWSIFHR